MVFCGACPGKFSSLGRKTKRRRRSLAFRPRFSAAVLLLDPSTPLGSVAILLRSKQLLRRRFLNSPTPCWTAYRVHLDPRSLARSLSSGKMAASLDNIDNIDDEEVLDALIKTTEDMDIKRKIRKRQSAIREKRHAAFEAQRQDRLAKQEDGLTMKLRMAEQDKQKRLKDLDEQAATKAAAQKDSSKDFVKERMAKAEEEKQKKLEALKDVGKSVSSSYNITCTDIIKEKEATKAPVAAAPFGASAGARQTGVTRNPSAIKQMLLDWCKAQCAGYENVNITNFSNSWNDGMAFCALIHRFYPDAFDFSKLNPKNRRGNFRLAFDLAEKLADIAPLLDVEDMVKMKNPDWKCVFTYVQSYYRRFAMQNKAPTSPASPTSPVA